MKLTLLFLLLFSVPSFACFTCDEDASVIVIAQSQIKFPMSYGSTELTGSVIFNVSVDSDGQLTQVEILNVFPSDLPREPILNMINRSRYKLTPSKKNSHLCYAKNIELTLEFPLPQKMNFNLDLDLDM